MPSVDIVIPVYNEERTLDGSVERLANFLQDSVALPWRIVIADNASTDGTLELARSLAEKYPQVATIHLDEKGRGRALRRAWLESPADIVCYMDVDLSTDLSALPPLLAAILEGYPVAIGSRLLPDSQVRRSVKREVISRIYNLLVRLLFFFSLSDAQCGFKALSRQTVRELVPLVKNQEWFFDSELLILALRKGYRVKEVPVTWVEDADSRVDILKTAWEDIRGLLRMRFTPLSK
ncbi:MAG: glycosyltransferase family 2 protein [Chloroflexi bacterium]|nr:glycosyltransferase family 2 protein [Chloroflexota bacterium]